MAAVDSTERWRWVPGFEGDYFVSDHGRVASMKMHRGKIGPRALSPGDNGSGHLQVNLFRDGSKLSQQVHRLVLLAFVGPCPSGCESRHLNGDGFDNRLANLAWGTRIENLDDRVRHGQIRVPHRLGTDHPLAKLTPSLVRRMRRWRERGMIYREIAERAGVSKKTAMQAVKGVTWAHVE